MIMNPTLATLLTTSVTVIAAIMVLVLIFLIPVLLQVRRTAHEAEKLIDSVRLQVAPISRDVGLISRDVKSIVQLTRAKRWSIGNFKMISEKKNEGRTNKEDDDFWGGSGYFDGFSQVNSSLCG
jgi:hypothetical protein